MANRFNRIIDQEYVSMPFQEILAAASIRQKTGDTNRALYDNASTMLEKYSAIPTSEDEKYKQQAETAIGDVINNYVSDHNKLYSPNSMYNFKKDINKAVDFNRLKLGHDSYGMYSKDIENQKLLQAQGKFKEELVPNDWKGWDSRKGVYDKFTPGYDESFTTTNPYIQNYTPHKDIDPATGQMREFVDMNDLAKQADMWAPNYMKSASFQHELAIAQKQGNPLAANPEMFAKDVLMRDWSYKLKDLEQRGWAGKGSAGSGDKDKKQSDPFDVGYDRLTNPESGLTMDDLDLLGMPLVEYEVTDSNGTKQKLKGNQVSFTKENTANKYGEIVAPKNFIHREALNTFQELDQLYKDVETKVGGKNTARYINTQWGEGVDNFNIYDSYDEHREPTPEDIASRNAIFEKTLASKNKLQFLLKRATGKDYSHVNLVDPFERDKALNELLDKTEYRGKYTAKDLKENLIELGTSLEPLNDGSPGVFVPNPGKENKTFTYDENGEYVMVVNGFRYETKEAVTAAMGGGGYNNVFDETWENKFVKEDGGNGFLKYTADGRVQIPTSIKIPLKYDPMDRINKGEYTATQHEELRPYFHEKRRQSAIERQQTAAAGSAVLQDIGKYDAAIGEYIKNTDESILRGMNYTKKSLRAEYDEALGSGDTYKLGKFARKMQDLQENNSFLEKIKAPETGNSGHVRNYLGSEAIGAYQINYKTWKKKFTEYGINGGNADKSLEMIKANPDKYKAMASDIVTTVKKEAHQLYGKHDQSFYDVTDYEALTYYLGQGNFDIFLSNMRANGGNEIQAWNSLPKDVTSKNTLPSLYLKKFNEK